MIVSWDILPYQLVLVLVGFFLVFGGFVVVDVVVFGFFPTISMTSTAKCKMYIGKKKNNNPGTHLLFVQWLYGNKEKYGKINKSRFSYFYICSFCFAKSY